MLGDFNKITPPAIAVDGIDVDMFWDSDEGDGWKLITLINIEGEDYPIQLSDVVSAKEVNSMLLYLADRGVKAYEITAASEVISSAMKEQVSPSKTAVKDYYGEEPSM